MPPPSSPRSQLPFLDLLRALASQLIVLHHLAFYGPMSTVAQPLAPNAIWFLSEHARMAVQTFLVLTGLLTARALAPDGEPRVPNVLAVIWKRYKRLGFPYLVAVAVAVGANELARHFMDHSSISAPPTPMQLVAHALLLHDVLQYEALTAGIWYVAIDFQFMVVVAVLLSLVPVLTSRVRRFVEVSSFAVMLSMLVPLAFAALAFFNRDSAFDPFVIYFFGSFFLGMLVQWRLSGRLARGWLWAYAALMVLAAVLDWRPRLLVAVSVGLLIDLAAASNVLEKWPRHPLVAYAARMSYSLFLIHFPVCLLVNAAVMRLAPDSPGASLAGMGVAYAASLAVGALFHRHVESRLAALPLPVPRFWRELSGQTAGEG